MSGLAASQLSKSYPVGDAGVLRILEEASLQLDRGRNAAIVGPSGSGKSTLLAILGTLDRPSGGTLSLDGIDPFTLGDRELAQFRNRRIGFVFQDHLLLPQCSVLENVLTPLLADGAADADDVRRGEALLERIGLADRRTHRPAQLSGGERQRVAIARALIRDPALLLADEPTGNLDRTTADSVAELLLELQRERDAVLVVATHSAALADRLEVCMELDDGRLLVKA
ncbi:MAG: ABC transporter ATP-binding protein [Planctomycetota bacterium]